MKIASEHIGRILESQLHKVQRTGVEKPTGAAPAHGADRATFSARAEEVELALSMVACLPDIRAERVAQLRAQIAAGTFAVSAEEVAQKILAEARSAQLSDR